MDKLWKTLERSCGVFWIGGLFTPIWGGGNVAAHIFAQMGVQHGSTKIWLDFISDCIRGIVSSESRTMFL
jgi:hypothetical protein